MYYRCPTGWIARAVSACPPQIQGPPYTQKRENIPYIPENTNGIKGKNPQENNKNKEEDQREKRQ